MKVMISQGSDIGGALIGFPPLDLKAVWQDVPTGLVVYCVGADTDVGPLAGDGFSTYYSTSSCSISLMLQAMPANAHTLNLTFAIQKPRSVEFLVKPPKPN